MGFWNRVFGGSDKESTENKPAQPQQFADPEDYSAVLMEKAAEETLAEELPMEKLPVEEMPAVTVTDSRKVFDWFRQICAIPHGSYHTKEISDFLVQFARDRGFVWEQDEADNVIIYCPASPGCELAQPLILQGHMDMVLEKEADREIDLEKEAITVLQDGDWLHADGTTLGGDDGIAVAMMLALMDDPSIVHPPLECVITSNEEVGMLGAQAINLSGLKGRRLLNLDSEEEGVITAGCAGGAEVHQRLKLQRRFRRGVVMNVRVSGLLGGHSGEAIRFGRANAILILARFLFALSKDYNFRIISIEGGGKDNAIPREACAKILLSRTFADEEAAQMQGDGSTPDELRARLEQYLGELALTLRSEYILQDPGMKIEWEIAREKTRENVFSRKTSKWGLQYLLAVPDGVLAYSPSFKDLPQTSLNLGILRSDEEGIETVFLVRSSLESQKTMVVDKLNGIAEAFGADSKVAGTYPAWEYRIESPFRDRVVSVYEKGTGKTPVVAVIHGGLECGLLSAKLPGLDAVSLGPDLRDIHTPAEKLSIASAERLWHFLVVLLEDLAADTVCP